MHITASPAHNVDLYWALSSSSSGTCAVVVSLTARLHQEPSSVPTSTATPVFNVSTGAPVLAASAADNATWDVFNISHMATGYDANVVASAFLGSGVTRTKTAFFLKAPGITKSGAHCLLQYIVKYL